MYERMLNKQSIPNEEEIEKYIGKKSLVYIDLIKKSLEKTFEIKTELKFPFGNKYGWGYKFSAKSKQKKNWINTVNCQRKAENIGRVNTRAGKTEAGYNIE